MKKKKKEQRERYAQMVFWISTESEMPEVNNPPLTIASLS